MSAANPKGEAQDAPSHPSPSAINKPGQCYCPGFFVSTEWDCEGFEPDQGVRQTCREQG